MKDAKPIGGIKKQFVGKWVTWQDTVRIEQELLENGQFEATIIDEQAGETCGDAQGTWEIVDDTIQWRYKSGHNIPIPSKVDINKIAHLDANQFSLIERSGARTDFYRATEFDDTSMNFDLEQVQPFLERVTTFVDSGFGADEINVVMKKVKKLKPEKSCQFVFLVTSQGITTPLHIRVFMDDIDAPDIYFTAPIKLARQIDEELNKLMP